MNVIIRNRDGEDIDLMAWSRLFDDPAYRTVAATRIRSAEVVTVWLGIDHNWRSRPPHVYETIVRGGSLDGVVWRWEDEAQAKDGHERVVELTGLNVVRRWWLRVMTRMQDTKS